MSGLGIELLVVSPLAFVLGAISMLVPALKEARDGPKAVEQLRSRHSLAVGLIVPPLTLVHLGCMLSKRTTAKAMMRSFLARQAPCITIDVLETSIAMSFVVELAGLAAPAKSKLSEETALP